jgi:hypothetical protein
LVHSIQSVRGLRPRLEENAFSRGGDEFCPLNHQIDQDADFSSRRAEMSNPITIANSALLPLSVSAIAAAEGGQSSIQVRERQGRARSRDRTFSS